jgi:hypothetical protein
MLRSCQLVAATYWLALIYLTVLMHDLLSLYRYHINTMMHQGIIDAGSSFCNGIIIMSLTMTDDNT